MTARGRGARSLERRASPSGRSQRSELARLTVPSQTSLLGLVRDTTRRMAEMSGFDETTAQQLALAVDEAVTNAIKHAYGGAEDRQVEIRFRDAGGNFCVDVIDSGVTVDVRTLPEVDLARYVSEGRTGGLGVHLMGKIMDSVTFRRASGRNVCCLVKHHGALGGPRH